MPISSIDRWEATLTRHYAKDAAAQRVVAYLARRLRPGNAVITRSEIALDCLITTTIAGEILADIRALGWLTTRQMATQAPRFEPVIPQEALPEPA